MNKRERILLIIAIIVITSLFGIRYAVLPAIDRYYAVADEFEKTEFELKKSKLQLMSSDKYVKKSKEINSQNQLLENFFYKGDPSNVRLKVLKFLDEEIKELGLIVESKELTIERLDKNSDSIQRRTNASQPSHEEIYTVKNPIKLSYRVQLEGDYLQLLSLLEDIRTYHKYYSISQLDIEVGSENQLAVFIVIESYCIEGDKDENREV